ncbi:MAG: lamin tail domain-containing protein, partial [Planctomycetales bacterium]|nr:lamin tail domain-containing protein [Planctomycetales bacterium]
VDGVNPNNPNRIEYVFDNVDIAAAINYIAATSIIHDNDAPHKNYHVYRDTEGSQQWTFLPWDKDLTFGLNFGLPGVIGNQDPFSHPFFGDSDHQKIDGKWNRLIDALFEIPSVREMYVRRLRSLMDQLLLPAGSPETSWLDRRIAELTADLQPEIGSTSWLNDVNRITNEYLVERRQHLYVDHSIDNPTYPDNAAIPDAQIGNPAILFGAMDASPASGNQDQEYLELTNPNTTAVDISNWRIEGGIAFTFRPGTVIPAGDTLYITPDVPAFLARTSGPRGGQQLFVQGNYSGHLSNLGEMLSLIAADGQVVDQTSTPNNPTATQQYLRITEVNFNPHDPLVQFGEENVDNDEFEFIEFVNTSGSQTLNLAGVRISGAVEYRFGTIEQVMNATFNQVTDGFTYVDDPFNSTNEPSHAAGARVAGVGPDGSGALRVYLDEAGSGADLAGTSGGWTNTFNVGEGGVYDLSVDYRMIVGQGFESDEFGEVLLQIDGTRIGTNANSSVLHVAGDGQNPSTPPVDSGWRTAQFKVPLTAGSHTLTIGGYNNKSTSTNEDVELYFDNVNLSGSVGELLLEPNERIVVVKNVDAFASRYGSVSSIAGTFFNGTTLPNGTGDVKLDDANGNTIVDFRYDDAWYRRADGRGSSLEIVSPSLDYSRWDSWQASLAFGGTPGSDALATRDVIINEVLANSDAPEPDAIELYNTGQQPVNIGGWLLSDTTNNLFKFVIPSGTVLQPGAYIVFDESDFNPGSGTQATDFALNSLGDDVWLVATSPTGKPTRVADAIAFDGSQVGVTLGRVDDGQFDYDLFPLQRSTLGSSNVEPQVGQVIISEVHYHPADGAAGQMPGAEFIELYNGSTSTQSLTGWQMRGAIDFAFADDTILSSGGIVILVPFDPLSTAIADDFRNRYGVPASTLLVGPFTGQLANSGEVLELLAPLVPGVVDSGSYLVDRVGYRDVAPWPTAADGVGSSLQRNTPTAFGDRAGNWFAASPTPGIVSFLTGRSTDFDQNGVVNATDLSVWAQGLESSTIAAQETGDADGDLDVDGRDFLAWQRDFGVPATVLSTASAESTLVETSLQRGTARSYRSALRPTMPEAVDQAIAEAYQQSPGMRQARPLQSARSVV